MQLQLLLIDNRVNDVQTVTNSLLENVVVVIVDFDNDTLDTLISKIPVKVYDSVGIFQENYETNIYQFIKLFRISTLRKVSLLDANLNTWSQYKSLLSYFKNTLQITTLDLMGCSIYSNPDWNYVIEQLGNQLHININSSSDKTGSPNFGGNWILESNNTDLVGKYFSNNINNYNFTLGPRGETSYVITTDNKLYGCGNTNDNSIMADSDYISTPIFLTSNITNVSKMFIGSQSDNTFVIKTDGSLWGVGSNNYGQLGTGNILNVYTLTKVYTPVNGITCISVFCGSSYTLMVLSDGSLWGTGANFLGQLGTGSTSEVTSFTKVYTPSNGVTCISASCGQYHTQMLLSNGSLWATGVNDNGQLGISNSTDNTNVFTKVYDPATNSGITCVSVSCGNAFTHILLSDGSVKAVGTNIGGQLGTNDLLPVNSFTTVYNPSNNSGITCTKISSGYYHTVLLLSDGSVKVTGSNFVSQLGTGDTTDVTSFTTVYNPSNNSGITCTKISCGQYHTQMLLSNGSVLATGFNDNGQLGTGNTTNVNSFTTVYDPLNYSGITCVAVSCGTNYTLILLSDGSIKSTGQNDNGQLGLSNGKYSKLTYLNVEVKFISNGVVHIAVIKSDGSLWTKGNNYFGQLGTGDEINRSVFIKVYEPSTNSGVTCVSVSCGVHYTQMLLSDGSLWATGRNYFGQLGTGDNISVTSFTKVYDPSNNSGITCIAVSCGEEHTQIVLSDGSLRATGINERGRLGTGNTTTVYSFTQVYTPVNDIKCIAVACGAYHTHILLSDGSLWANGNNDYGLYGSGNTTTVYSFIKVYNPSNNFNIKCTAVSCGFTHTQILLSDGSLWGAGYNLLGELGTGYFSPYATRYVSSFTKVYTPVNDIICVMVYCYKNNTQMLLSDGLVKNTGSNYNGILGLGTTHLTQNTSNSFQNMLKSDGTNMSSVYVLPENVAPALFISNINGVSPTRESPTIEISFIQSLSNVIITNYSYSIDGTNYTALSPAQTNSTLVISASEFTTSTRYTFRIRAITNSGSINAFCAVAGNVYIPSVAPTITSLNSISATRQNPTISISFTQSIPDATITNYFYSADGTNYTALSPLQTSSPLTVSVSGLTSGSLYTFSIKAFNGAVSSVSSGNSSIFYTPSLAPTITSINGLSMNFTQSPTDSTITNYSYSIDGTNYNVLSPVQISSPLTIPTTGLKFGSLYTYRIKAINNAGSSSTSNGIAKIMATIIPCFKDDTKILTKNGYVQIKDLINGDLVETFGHGLKPITVIGKKLVIHLATPDRNPEQLYKYTNATHSSIFEDLIITGRHAILVDDFASDEQRDNVFNFYKELLKTDNKYLLPSCVDDSATVYETVGQYTVYNLALQNDDETINYGIYANGLLVETASEDYLKNRSKMELIE